MTTAPASKNVELVTLKAKLAKGVTEGPSSEELARLKEENAKQALEIRSLTQQLCQAY